MNDVHKRLIAQIQSWAKYNRQLTVIKIPRESMSRQPQ